MMDNNQLTLKARAIASCLTYNDDTPQAEAKYIIIEMAHRIDTITIRVSKSHDELIFINGRGMMRKATFKEWFLSWTQSGAGVCNRLQGEAHEKRLYLSPCAQRAARVSGVGLEPSQSEREDG